MICVVQALCICDIFVLSFRVIDESSFEYKLFKAKCSTSSIERIRGTCIPYLGISSKAQTHCSRR